MEYLVHLLILIIIYTMLAQSLNLAAGYAGLISLSHAGFYGIGAYTTAILSHSYHLSFWLNLPIAMILSFVVALMVSQLALRTVDDYFIICTLGIQVIIFSVMNNWMSITRGPIGITGIPSIHFLGISIDDKISFLILASSFMLIIWYALNNLSNSGFGNILRAISEDEIFSQSIGKNVYKSKIVSFTLSSMLASVPGTLYAHYTSYIDPTSFTAGESIFILSIVIVGGLGSLKGSLFAATFMILLPEALRFLGLPDSIAANLRQIIYGLILIVVVRRDKYSLKNLMKQLAQP